MGTDRGSPDFDATKAELFEAISHSARIKIQKAWSEKPFHLTKLESLAKETAGGIYLLTNDGKEALWGIQSIGKEEY